MKMSRKAKRYDDSVLPGDFHDFEPFQTGDPARDGRVEGALRRRGAALELEHLVVERTSSRKQSFAKLRSKAEDLDLAEAISDLSTKETVYQAALKSYATMGKMSLFDYIGT